ncbi:hypothetical protein BDR26DRAFT_858265 [Obelidium mucronatum]|nr:hypothetical protein BDR26DRAFT_858265 [Obelidium mucronatum]
MSLNPSEFEMHDASNLSTMWRQLDLLEQRGALINELYKQMEILKQENAFLKAQITTLTEANSITSCTSQILPTSTTSQTLSKYTHPRILSSSSNTVLKSPPQTVPVSPTPCHIVLGPGSHSQAPLSHEASAPLQTKQASLISPSIESVSISHASVSSKDTSEQWCDVVTTYHVPVESPESAQSSVPSAIETQKSSISASSAPQWKEVTTRFQVPTEKPIAALLGQKQPTTHLTSATQEQLLPIPVNTATIPASFRKPKSPSEYTICAISGISRRNISDLKNDLKRGNVDTTKIANIHVMQSFHFQVLAGGATLVPPANCANVTGFYNALFRRFHRTISRQNSENITSCCYQHILNEMLETNAELKAVYSAFLLTYST